MTPNAANQLKAIKIMNRLREEAQPYHAKLESLPFFTALIDHQLPLECYINQLNTMSVIHGVLENEISTSEDKRLLAVWDDKLRKLPLLEADLAFFKAQGSATAASPGEAALAMTEKIWLRRVEQPVSLLGYLYVFEGTTLGNSLHTPDVAQTFDLDDFKRCSYYNSYNDQVHVQWHHFSKKMNQTVDDLSLHDPVIKAAHEAFSGLEILYSRLYPLSKG